MKSRVTLVCWVVTVAIVVIDAAFMREQILAPSAIPYFDQAQYVEKVITRMEPGNDRVALMALVNDDFVDNAGLQRGSR